MLSDREKADFREELIRSMKTFRASNADSFLTLADWLPGISGHDDAHLNLFEPVSEDFRHIQTTGKRLSSLTHWRYYYAFSSPQNVLPTDFFNELLSRQAYRKTSSSSLKSSFQKSTVWVVCPEPGSNIY